MHYDNIFFCQGIQRVCPQRDAVAKKVTGKWMAVKRAKQCLQDQIIICLDGIYPIASWKFQHYIIYHCIMMTCDTIWVVSHIIQLPGSWVPANEWYPWMPFRKKSQWSPWLALRSSIKSCSPYVLAFARVNANKSTHGPILLTPSACVKEKVRCAQSCFAPIKLQEKHEHVTKILSKYHKVSNTFNICDVKPPPSILAIRFGQKLLVNRAKACLLHGGLPTLSQSSDRPRWLITCHTCSLATETIIWSILEEVQCGSNISSKSTHVYSMII